MKIVMVAGGSGGHIYPALTLANALTNKGHDITFIGSNDRMEKDVIPEAGYKYIPLDVYTTRGGLIQKIKSVFSIVANYFKCLDIVKDFDAAIGFGNYISLPVMFAAIKLKKKTIIHEQNSYVGRANRILDTKVDMIIGTYKENLNQFKNKNIKILGNPQSSRALELKKDKKVIEGFGLDANKKTVVIFLGSLGSESVMKKLIDMFKLLDGSYQVIYATGKAYFNEVKEKVSETPYLKIREKINGIEVMNNADLLVSRSGATTLSEITAIGMPSILIPSPYVPNNHQYKNAKSLADNNAAMILEEKDLTPQALKTMIDEMINDDKTLNELRKNARSLNNDNVLKDIIDVVENI